MALELSTAGLTEKQTVFLTHYVSSGDIGASAIAAGYEQRQMGYQALRSPAVQKALNDHINRRIKIEGARLAIATMLELMKPGQPAGVRFQAAKWTAEAAGFGPKEADAGRAKPLAEMTESELSATIDRLKAQVAEPESPETGRIPPLADGEVQLDQ